MDAFIKQMDAIWAQKSTQLGLSFNVCQGSHISELCAVICEPLNYMQSFQAKREPHQFGVTLNETSLERGIGTIKYSNHRSRYIRCHLGLMNDNM